MKYWFFSLFSIVCLGFCLFGSHALQKWPFHRDYVWEYERLQSFSFMIYRWIFLHKIVWEWNRRSVFSTWTINLTSCVDITFSIVFILQLFTYVCKNCKRQNVRICKSYCFSNYIFTWDIFQLFLYIQIG